MPGPNGDHGGPSDEAKRRMRDKVMKEAYRQRGAGGGAPNRGCALIIVAVLGTAGATTAVISRMRGWV